MKINPKYLEMLKNLKLDTTKGIVFGFLISFKHIKGLQDFILDDEEGKRAIFPYEEFQKYSINLCSLNVNTGENELIEPLFDTGVYEDQDYVTFMKLLELRNIGNQGHINSPVGFNIYSTDDLQALRKTMHMIENCDLTKLADVVSEYYQTTNYASKLCNFLGSQNVVSAYNLYQ